MQKLKQQGIVKADHKCTSITAFVSVKNVF